LSFLSEDIVNKYNWLSKATDQDSDRPVLQRIHYEDGLAIATDGYNLHVTTAEKYPDWRSVIKTIDPENGIYFAIDAKKLIKAIEGMDTVTFHVSGAMEPVEISGEISGDPFYAVVMPMRKGARDDDPKDVFWRPQQAPTP